MSGNWPWASSSVWRFLRRLSRRKLIILDEPTAVLTPQEVNDLFVTLRRMAMRVTRSSLFRTSCRSHGDQ